MLEIPGISKQHNTTPTTHHMQIHVPSFANTIIPIKQAINIKPAVLSRTDNEPLLRVFFLVPRAAV